MTIQPAPEPVLPLTVATLEALATSRRDLWRLCAPQGDARGRAWTVINAFEAAVRKDERARAVAAAALGRPQDEDARERHGRRVREVWIAWAKEQPDVAERRTWLVPYDDLPERDREVDRRIGAALWGDGFADGINYLDAAERALAEPAVVDDKEQG